MDERDAIIGDVDVVREVFEQSQIGTMALRGRDYITWAANAAYREFFPLWRVGVPILELSPATRPFVEVFDQVYDSGNSAAIEGWRVQYDPDGSGELIERYADLAVSPIRDRDGVIVGVQVTVADSSETVFARRAEQQRAAEMADKYFSARDAVAAMQKALLPTSTPIVPGADVAAAYLVAAEDTAAGGDWFDAIPTADSRVFLVLGDVVGHGAAAAAVMAQLRAAVRMQLLDGMSLSDTIAAVDRFARTVPGAHSTTLCIGELHTRTGRFDYCTAGHPPPMKVNTDRSAVYLDPTGSAPLGHIRTGVHTATAWIEMGEAVVFYSDGIIERPGRTPAQSSVEFAAIVARAMNGAHFPLDPDTAAVDRLCSQAIELSIRTTGFRDDITLLAAQRRPISPPLQITAPADGSAEHNFRKALRGWLETLSVPDIETTVVEHAVSEYVVNAAEHAYRSAPSKTGEVSLSATLLGDGRLQIEICDTGKWREPERADSARGRGLSMAALLIPDTVIDHPGGRGTVVTARYRLTRDAHILTDAHAEFGQPPTPGRDFAFRTEATADTVTVSGDVDTAGAASLAGILAARSAAGTAPLRVDLTGVTHFGSAAVNVLTRHLDTAAAHHQGTTLVAPPGTTAHHVLSLVGLAPSSADDTVPPL